MATVLLGVAVLPMSTAAQAPRMVAGLVFGYTTTEHDWSPSADVSGVGGIAFGGFAEVQTPLAWLTAGVELAYVQRGSDLVLDVGGTPSPGGIRADHLTLSVRARAALGLGRARLYLVAGPVSDFVVRSRLDPLLIQVLEEESPAPLGVIAGAGVGAWITDELVLDVEVRIVEGVQSSYSGDFISARNRSRELVARLGLFVGQ